MLQLMSHANDSAAAASRPSSGTQQERRSQLLAMYVDSSFARHSASNRPTRYSRAQTLRWLGWLAGTLTRQSQPVLYLDRLQPDWLPTAKALAWYGVVDRMGSGLIVTLASTLLVWAGLALVAGAPTWDDAGAAFLVSLIPGVTAAVLGGAAIPRARRLAGGVPLSRRVILAGLTGGLLGGAAGTGAAALGIPQIPGPDLLPIVEFGLVFGAISSWLACTLSTRQAGRRGLIQRVARRGLAGAVLGGAIGLLAEFVAQAFNFADTHAVGMAESSWALIASAPRWVPALEWPNAFSNQSIVGCLYGLAFGVLGTLLARGRHTADSRADRGRFLRGAASGALVIGAVGVGLGELLALGGGFATEASPLIGLLGAVIGGLAGGLAGGPGGRGRRIATAEPVRWSTRNALGSGFTGLLSGLWIGMLGGGLAFGFFGWLGVSASDPLKSRFNLELIVGGPYSALTQALTGATVFGVELGLVFAVAYGLTRGLDVGDVEPALAPNQGVWRSARRAALTGLWGWGVVTAGLLLLSGSVEALVPVSTAGFVLVGFLFGLAAALAVGGYACLSHLALRVVLWRARLLPVDTIQFLEYATERTFLRRVGGGYMFRHALLQEYFASSSASAAPVPSGAETVPARASFGLARALLSVVTVAAVLVAVVVARVLSGAPTSDGPLSAADYLQRADAAWHSRNYAIAEQADTRAIALQPDSAAAYNLRALIRASAGRPEEALVDANQAVALCQAADCTRQSDLLDTRGYVYLELARYQSAARDYEQILESGFRYPTAVLGRGLAYAGMGRNSQALDDLEALVRPASPGEVSDPQLDDLVLQARQTRARLQAESAN